MDKYQFKKIWIKKVSVISAAFVLLNIILYLSFLRPDVKKLKENKDLVEKTKKELQQYYIFDTTSYEIEKFKNIVEKIKKDIIFSSDVEQVFFKKVDEISKNIGIKTENISSEESSEKENSKVFSLSFKGSFQKICNFLFELEKNPFFTIKTLSISSGRNIPQHNVTMKVKVYFSK